MACLPSRWRKLLLFGALLIAQATEARHFHPRDVQPGVGAMPVAKRQDNPAGTCEAATPNVNETAIFQDACSQNPQNNIAVCYNQLTAYVNASARATCAYFYTQYNDCLQWGSNNASSCTDALAGYQNCANYTLQAYATCGCYYQLPSFLSSCANVLLQIRPSVINSSNIPTNSISPTLTLSGPILPATATSTPPPARIAPFNNFLMQDIPSSQTTSTIIATSYYTLTDTTSCSDNTSSCSTATTATAAATLYTFYSCDGGCTSAPPASWTAAPAPPAPAPPNPTKIELTPPTAPAPAPEYQVPAPEWKAPMPPANEAPQASPAPTDRRIAPAAPIDVTQAYPTPTDATQANPAPTDTSQATMQGTVNTVTVTVTQQGTCGMLRRRSHLLG